ncbi:MAG: sugar phosphate isomerase/epimerase [Clostridia bacterium]|nr:sugar phosphate isomerase/epimerase [Clostridia bacterium]
MLKSGLVSVSFRALEPEEIIRITAEAGLAGIEWGGDVHVPPGDPENARRIGALTRAAGLEVSGYGTYYRLGRHVGDLTEEFAALLETAKALCAPVMRIWAGTKASADVSEDERAALVAEAKTVARMAENAGVPAAFECHRNTLTDDYRSAVRLMSEIGSPFLRMYWQPNESRSPAYDREALAALLPYIENVHVFNWPDTETRRPLEEAGTLWQGHFSALAADGKDRWCLLEFMPDDDPASLKREAAALTAFMKQA